AEQGELLAERQVLQREIGMAPERSTGGAQESEYEGHCAPASLGVIPSSSVTIEFWQTTGINGPLTAGGSSSLTVEVKDAFGNRATAYLGTVAFGTSDAQGTVPAPHSFTATD